MIRILENKDLKKYSAFKIGGEASIIFDLDSEEDAWKAHHLAKDEKKDLVILGHGTNSIFNDEKNNFVVGIVKIRGIRIIQNFDKSSIIEVGAGENWDDFVKWTIENKHSGLECLSGIPGTVGATPIQNVGAYSKEVSDYFVNLHALDRKLEKFVILGLKDCDFGYRDSIFKREPNRFIITKVGFELKKTPAEMPTHKDLKLYFLGQIKPSARQIRNAVLDIRSKKIPNYKEIPNCGSFFKNPFVDVEIINKLLEKYPRMPHFQIDENTFKLYAGWLLENINWQKLETKNIKFSPKNKLILTNIGDASFAELEKVIKNIQKEIERNFKIKLEIEPKIF